MEDIRCFESGCVLNAEYECRCSFPPVYSCKLHVLSHMETPNKDHALKSIFGEPCEKIREAILLPKCDPSINEDFNNKFKEVEKSQINYRNINAEENLKAEKSEILENSKNSELERKLKAPSSACESDFRAHEKSVTLAYLDIVSTHHPKPFLFNVVYKDKRTNLLVYNTEIESQSSIILETPQRLGAGTCITQIPNGKLFCFGNYPLSGITLLIDQDYRVEELPSGTVCAFSSAIYFNNNVYCFGGWNENSLTLSSRFDMNRNQWNELTPLPNADRLCSNIIFNGSILIAGCNNKNLLRYSIDSNSFSTIPYDFAEKRRKILIKAERLYLIDCGKDGLIYESEIGNDTAWRQIVNSPTFNMWPIQTYCQYRKEEIYIGCVDGANKFCCLKLNLHEKRLAKCLKIVP